MSLIECCMTTKSSKYHFWAELARYVRGTGSQGRGVDAATISAQELRVIKSKKINRCFPPYLFLCLICLLIWGHAVCCTTWCARGSLCTWHRIEKRLLDIWRKHNIPTLAKQPSLSFARRKKIERKGNEPNSKRLSRRLNWFFGQTQASKINNSAGHPCQA